MKLPVIALLATLTAAPAMAQDLYIGGGLDYGKPHSGDDQTSLSFLAGVRLGAGPLGYGIEADLSRAIGKIEDYDAQRIRLFGTYDFGPVTGLASVGVVQYDASGVKHDGDAYGLGIERDFSDKLTGRFEFIRDLMDDSYPTDVTTTRLAIFYNF